MKEILVTARIKLSEKAQKSIEKEMEAIDCDLNWLLEHTLEKLGSDKAPVFAFIENLRVIA